MPSFPSFLWFRPVQRAKCEQQATFRRGPEEVQTRSPSSESNMVPLRSRILLESHFALRQELTVAEVGELAGVGEVAGGIGIEVF